MEIKASDVIEWLMERRYDDDMIEGNERRINNNRIVDTAIRYASEHLVKPGHGEIESEDLMTDPDCVGGHCPVR